MEVIDISDPNTLRNLMNRGVDDSPASFITELVTMDSDIEEDDDDDVIRTTGPPIHRQELVDDDDNDDDDNNNDDEDNTTWRTGACQPVIPPFTGDSGLQVEVEDDNSPFSFFKQIITNDMMDHIIQETNRYATNCLAIKELSPRSRFRRWSNVTLGEMWAFFGLIIAMGLILIEDLDEYWSGDAIYSLPLFRSVMGRDRFCLILSFLHAANNEDQLPKDNPEADPLFKIRQFVDSLRDNFQRTFKPGKNIAIDEAMVAWRGHLAFRVYNPAKPDKFGIKIFELCDSENGFCCNLEFYTGKQQHSPRGATFDVVDRLIAPYLNSGRTLFIDNYYTSHDLLMYLKANNTLACGTLRLNRKNGPPKSMLPKLNKKDTTTAALTNGSINLLRFFDKREVNIMTTAHTDNRINTGKINPVTKEPIVRLHAVAEYNRYMGAVDRSDQMVSYNAFKRRTLKWWKKTFFHLFMLAVLNSYLLYKKRCAQRSVKPMTHRIFRRELAKELLQWLVTPLTHSMSLRMGERGSSAVRLSVAGGHFPEIIPQKPGTTSRLQRVCVVCGGSKKSRFECRQCDVGLHVESCFKIYHTVKDFKRHAKRRLAVTD